MKKLMLSLTFIAMFFVACQDNSEEISPNQEVAEIDMSDFYVYTDDNLFAKSAADAKNEKCASMKVLNQQLKDNPALEKRMYDIEYHTRKAIAAKGKPGSGGGGGTPPPPTPYNGTITIPVYVHVIYSNTQQNISDAQIHSQITVLNDDFNDTNFDNVPAEFKPVGADIDINFTLNSDNIIRHSDNTSSWGTNNAVKNKYPPVAGYLNFWVCNIGGGILGYAQFPGGSMATDGVVITSNAFGETSGVYGDGRTATHEVGHWLNLRHIWGDGGCSVDDYVTDTPKAGGPNYTCAENNSCDEGAGDLPDMTMNYMDYVYDNCMYMFTNGQNDRMRTIFGNGGFRASFVN